MPGKEQSVPAFFRNFFVTVLLFFAAVVSACGTASDTDPRPSGRMSAKDSVAPGKYAKEDIQAQLRQARKLARGGDREMQQAFEIFRKAADAGHPEGMGRLARAYRLGHGVQKDYAMALKLYEKAVAAGYSAGKVGIGHMYRLGSGVEKDEAKACALYLSAAGQGVPGGMYYYGRCLEYGSGGMSSDPVEAELWYRKALNSDKDYCYAYIGLARLFTRGEGVGKNLEEAAKIYKSAEERGCTAPGRLPE